MKSSKNFRIIACFRKAVIKFTMKLKFSMQNNISPTMWPFFLLFFTNFIVMSFKSMPTKKKTFKRKILKYTSILKLYVKNSHQKFCYHRGAVAMWHHWRITNKMQSQLTQSLCLWCLYGICVFWGEYMQNIYDNNFRGWK